MAQEQSCVTIQPSDLLQFLEEVRGPNLPFSPQQLISAHQLLLTLLAQGEWPDDPLQFQVLLAPVLCSSAEQQRFFYDALKLWLEKRSKPESQGGSTGTKPGSDKNKSEIPAVPRRPKQVNVIAAINLFTGLPLLILHLCALVVFSVLVLLQPKPPNPIPVPPTPIENGGTDEGGKPTPPPGTKALIGQITDVQGQPLANVEVAYLHKITKSNTDGSFVLQFTEDRSPFLALFSRSGYSPQLRTVPLTPALRVQMPPAAPLPGTTYTSAGFYWFRWTTTFAAPVLCLAWFIYRRLRLNRWSRPLSAKLRKVDPAVPANSVYMYASIRRLAAKLRRPRPSPSSDLDPVETVHASARQAGYFTPVLSVSKKIPEYLILIERIYEKDHFGRLYRDLVEQLVAQHVRAECFEFQADPRSCHGTNGDRAVVSFGELAANYPHHAVAVFCEPRTLRDPITAHVAPWVSRLSLWKESAIFSSTELYGWPSTALGSRGITPAILPATLEGLERWTEPRQSLGEASPNGHASYPLRLTDPPDRWLEPGAPNSRDLAQLCVELREFLGRAGYNCLRACALYPLLFWPLTLFFAWRLVPDQSERLKVMEKLVRLPWFRYGAMPDWLRIRLLSGFTDREAGHIRDLLSEYLDGPESKGASSEPIEVVERWSKDARPLQDYIFLSFLWGKKLDRLNVRPPARWRSMLLRFGFWWQPRMIGVIALAVAFGVAAWFAAGATQSKWKRTAPSVIAQPPSDAALAHVISVAQSQLPLTDQWDGTTPFVSWCFDTAGKIYLYSHFAADATESEEWTNARNIPFPKDKVQLDQVHAGMIFATQDTGTVHTGFVEAVQGNTLFTIENVNGSVRRNVRTFEDISLGLLDYSLVGTSIRLPDGTVDQPYSALVEDVPESPQIDWTTKAPGLKLTTKWILTGIPILPGDYSFTVSGEQSPGNPPGKRDVSYRLRINPANSTTLIPLPGSTIDLNVGEVPVGSSHLASVRMGIESSPAEVTLKMVSGSPFIVSGQCAPVGTKECEVTIRFSPTATGQFRTVMEIIRKGSPVASVRLIGTGIPAINPSTAYLIDGQPFSDVFFDFDKADIRPDQAIQLRKDEDSMRSILKTDPTAVFVIEGNTDERRSVEYSLSLGQKLADSVKQFLVKDGIPVKNISTISYGKEKPVCTQSTESCWVMDRRVHFSLRSSSGAAPPNSTSYLLNNEPFTDIYFDSGSAEIRHDQLDSLRRDVDSIRKILTRNPKFEIGIYGHAGGSEPKGLDEDLAAERAAAVRDFLIKQQIAKVSLPVLALTQIEECTQTPAECRRASFALLEPTVVPLPGEANTGSSISPPNPAPNSQPTAQNLGGPQTNAQLGVASPIDNNAVSGNASDQTGNTLQSSGTTHAVTGTSVNNNTPSSRTGFLHNDVQEARASQKLDEDRAKLPPDDPQIVRDLVDLAELYSQDKAYDAAKPYYLQALEIDRKGNNPTVISDDLTRLGNLSLTQGEYSAAEGYFKEAANTDGMAKQPARQAIDLGNLAAVLMKEGQYKRAEASYQEALEIDLSRGNHANAAYDLNALAHVLEAEGDFTNARTDYQRALQFAGKISDPNNSLADSIRESLNRLDEKEKQKPPK